MKRPAVIVAGVASVLAAVLIAKWWFSDERAIRRQLGTIAEALTVAPGASELTTVTRVASLRKTLAPDIRVTIASQEIVSRDAVVGLVGRWITPPGGVRVEFADVQVTVGPERTSAEVYCTAKVITKSAAGEPTLDARELTVGLTKQDGTWLVSQVRPGETLVR